MDDLIRYNKILVLLYFGGKFSRGYSHSNCILHCALFLQGSSQEVIFNLITFFLQNHFPIALRFFQPRGLLKEPVGFGDENEKLPCETRWVRQLVVLFTPKKKCKLRNVPCEARGKLIINVQNERKYSQKNWYTP